MQPTPNVEQPAAAQVLTKVLSLVNNNDQTWVDLFAEDAVYECPYAPLTTKHYEGCISHSQLHQNRVCGDTRFEGSQYSDLSNDKPESGIG